MRLALQCSGWVFRWLDISIDEPAPVLLPTAPLTPPSVQIYHLSIITLTNEFHHGSKSEHITD